MSNHEQESPKAPPQADAGTTEAASPVATDPAVAGPAATSPAAIGPAAIGPAALDAGLQGHLGRYLRHLYDDVVQQPVPDRFVKLLEELERKSADRK